MTSLFTIKLLCRSVPSTDSLKHIFFCTAYTMWLAIFFVATGLASASMTNLVLSEEKTDMSKNGTLCYGSLSFQEKMSLFKRYEIEANRKVTECDDPFIRHSIPSPSRLILNCMFNICAVLIFCTGVGQIRCF